MSVNYTLLFTRLGRVVKWVNSFLTLQGTYLNADGLADDIQDEYAANRDLVANLQTAAAAMAQGEQGNLTTVLSIADATLGDLQTELNAPGNDAAGILDLLRLRMIDDAQTLKHNNISAYTNRANANNHGNGTLVASLIEPFTGRNDERIISQVLAVRCLTDQFTGTGAGAEQFQIVGYPDSGASSYLARGNGNGPRFTVANGASLLTNGDFETFSSNAPTGWDLTPTSGAGLVIFQDTATANLHSGTAGSSLKLTANGTNTTIALVQTFAGQISPYSSYAVGGFLKRGTWTGAVGGTLTIALIGTTLGTINLFSGNPATAAGTSYAFIKAGTDGFFQTGAVVDSDLRLSISWGSANATSGASIYLDDLAIVPATDYGHAKYAIFRGSTDFSRNDNFSLTNSSDYAGVFQTFFGRFYDKSLPSVSGTGSSTIDDTLATS